jgi:hypothetical protein
MFASGGKRKTSAPVLSAAEETQDHALADVEDQGGMMLGQQNAVPAWPIARYRPRYVSA